MSMMKIGALGAGNTGNQIVTLAKERLDIPVIAINSSMKDLETLPDDVKKYRIADQDGMSQGAGKNRELAKKFLKDSIIKLLNDEHVISFLVDLDICFVVASMGGGTGSGTAPIIMSILSQQFPDTLFILVGVGPVQQEALSAHVNTMEFLQEMYANLPNVRYMLYDNDNYADMSSYKMMEKVNSEVVEDMKVLSGFFNIATKYDSIDKEDTLRLLSFPGRIAVARVEDIKEKDLDSATIEERLIQIIKKNAHMELQRDQKVMATGLITNLSSTMIEGFNNHIPRVHDLIGEPVHEFLHVGINPDRKDTNSVFLIMSGLSAVNDKIAKISERIEEIEERQRIQEEQSALDAEKIGQLSSMISKNDGRKTQAEENVDLEDIFSKFM